MCTSNSGLPFNQPSKSSTKWALVMYRPGDGGGGETPPPPPPPQYSTQAMRAEGLGEKSVSTGTTAITGVAGGCSGSSSRRFPCTSKDRKSTRLNSSHVSISYAVFCLKKKNGLVRS